MKAIVTLLAVAALLCSVHALPASACVTVTSDVVVPTTTYTFTSTFVTTVRQTTPHLATWTQWIVVPSTKTLRTLTTTVTDCTAYETFSPVAHITVNGALETSAVAPSLAKREDSQQHTPGCTITTSISTAGGATWLYVPANETSTYTQYTAWSVETISSTTSTGTSYVIATETTTTCQICEPTTTLPLTGPAQTTPTYDAKCLNPTSANIPPSPLSTTTLYGLSYLDDTPLGGAMYHTNASNPQACCQLCVEQPGCAGSAWDVRSNECRLEFPVDVNGETNCGLAAQAYYDAGPVAPMAPGTGWHVAQVCGTMSFAAAKPDDGT